MISPYCGEDLWYTGSVLVEMTFDESMRKGAALLCPVIQGTPFSIQEVVPNHTKEGKLELLLRLRFGGRGVNHSLTPCDTKVLMQHAGAEYVDDLEGGIIYGDILDNRLFYDSFRKE